MQMNSRLRLAIPDVCHEETYTAMMDRWEATGESIAPSLLSRYSSKAKENVTYAKWLEWCEDDRTTGSMLAANVPCTLYFLIKDEREIVGGIEINHGNTHRGHLHVGIVPWHRGKGYGTTMLALALEKCREMGFKTVQIVPHKGNDGAVKTILKNGSRLIEEFCEEGLWSQRYEIQL